MPLALILGLVLPVLLAPTATAGQAWVERMQRRLNTLHCDAGPADGTIDDRTRAGLVRFQSRHRLAQTAKLDDATRDRLYSERARPCHHRPVPTRTGTGRRIVISQRQNWVWLVGPQGGVVAQGGIIDNPSVLKPGSYRTGSYCGRAARIKRNSTPSGTLYLDNFVRFAPCGIGFHRIPRYVSNGRQIHADWLLGTNFRESHGCVRLSRAMSLAVWEFTAGPSVPVRVVSG